MHMHLQAVHPTLLLSTQVEKMRVHLFRTLGFSEKQKEYLADAWELWSARRFALDRQFGRAREHLECLLPPHEIVDKLRSACLREGWVRSASAVLCEGVTAGMPTVRGVGATHSKVEISHAYTCRQPKCLATIEYNISSLYNS
jgi:hypothetical protein